MVTIQFTIRGTTPMLQHNPASMARPTTTPTRKVIPSPEDEAELGAYRMGNGALGVPSTAVRNAILSGSKGLRIGKSAARPYFAGALLIAEAMFPLLDADMQPLTNYVVDIQRAVIQKQGILRARPRIDPPWLVACSFRFNPIVSAAQLEVALRQAGEVGGRGDYRIEKNGGYGAFEQDGEIQTNGVEQ